MLKWKPIVFTKNISGNDSYGNYDNKKHRNNNNSIRAITKKTKIAWIARDINFNNLTDHIPKD